MLRPLVLLLAVVGVALVQYLAGPLVVQAAQGGLELGEPLGYLQGLQLGLQLVPEEIQLDLHPVELVLRRIRPSLGRAGLLLGSDLIHVHAVQLQPVLQVLLPGVRDPVRPALVLGLPEGGFLPRLRDAVLVALGHRPVQLRVVEHVEAVRSQIIGLGLCG